MEADFRPFAERMEAERLPETAIRTFKHYYKQLAQGHTGMIPERDIRPLASLPDLEQLPAALAETGRGALSKAVLLKLNGGLGTGMGLEKAKSLLTVRTLTEREALTQGEALTQRKAVTFLDIIARQALHARVPLVLMNSFATRDDSLRALAKYPKLQGSIPLDFLQHKVPKVLQDGLRPADWPQDRELEWCPPGHGDIYTALVTSGMLDTLLEHGHEVAFVSNADNLGAVLDPLVLGYFVANELPFLMEVADRTAADRKGGHLAQRLSDGRLVLRESAQCPDADMDAFQDIELHRYFNTNNLWVHLPSLKRLLAEKDGVLGLPMIRNSKTLDPRDPSTPKVYQLETAMGAAISSFEDAAALRVPRTRFAPVKTCDDLLGVRSDAYVLTGDWRVVLNPERRYGVPVISLDSKYYKLIDQMEVRFPYGPPSLIECESLTVKGDVRFGRGVVCRGEVEVVNEGPGQKTVESTLLGGTADYRRA
ncbi:MAG: UTP--glucose-1-phosphate uridylyltransferase [Nitrososphaerales archaeon]